MAIIPTFYTREHPRVTIPALNQKALYYSIASVASAVAGIAIQTFVLAIYLGLTPITALPTTVFLASIAASSLLIQLSQKTRTAALTLYANEQFEQVVNQIVERSATSSSSEINDQQLTCQARFYVIQQSIDALQKQLTHLQQIAQSRCPSNEYTPIQAFRKGHDLLETQMLRLLLQQAILIQHQIDPSENRLLDQIGSIHPEPWDVRWLGLNTKQSSPYFRFHNSMNFIGAEQLLSEHGLMDAERVRQFLFPNSPFSSSHELP